MFRLNLIVLYVLNENYNIVYFYLYFFMFIILINKYTHTYEFIIQVGLQMYWILF
jgi:hypothetical protein